MSASLVEPVERDSAASPSSLTSGSSGGGNAAKHSVSGWDSQLRLQSAQQQAIAQITQSIAAQTALYSPLRHTAYTPRLATNTTSSHALSTSPAAQLWLLSPADSAQSNNSSQRPALSSVPTPAHLAHKSWEQQLLSTYLSSPSPSASSPSPAYSLLVASHGQLSSLVSLSSSLLSHLSLLHQHQALVEDKTNKVREECSALLEEQRALLAQADRYAANLYYYQQADKIATQLQHTLTITNTSTSTSLDAASFPAILTTIDQCTAYLNANSTFHSSIVYLAKYERLKEKLLRLMRQHVGDTLNEAEKRDRAEREKEKAVKRPIEVKEASEAVVGVDEAASLTDSDRQSSWLRSFVAHRALAPQLAPLIRDLERRAADAPAKSLYATTLADIQQLYMQQRQRLVVSALSEYVATISKEKELTALTRAAVSALLSLCSLETQLFDVLFSDVSRPLLSSLLTNLASILYTALRPVVIRQTDIDVLCEVIIILKEETSNFNAAAPAPIPSTPSSSSSSPSPSSASSSISASTSASSAGADNYLSILRRLVGDCQERLSYRASVFIRDEVAGYKNTQSDVDWRAKLSKLNGGATASHGNVDGSSQASGKEEKDEKSMREEKNADGPDGVSLAEWHPALERTLITLSKLYRCLEPNVFKILAQEAIAECLHQLTACERNIAAQPGPPPATGASSARLPSTSATLHATLWLIQQLLTLRSQLSPFPLDLSSPHKQHALDFSHMAQALPSLFSSSAKWTSFSDLVQLSTPRVHEVRNDSKRAIDRMLRDACERCIAQLTHHSIGPLIGFFQRTAQKQQTGAANDGQQFRAELCNIMDQLTGMSSSGLAAVLFDLQRLVRAYLTNSMAERSLFAPVKRALMETTEQLRFFVNTHYAVAEGASEDDMQTAAKLHNAISTLDRLVQSIDA